MAYLQALCFPLVAGRPRFRSASVGLDVYTATRSTEQAEPDNGMLSGLTLTLQLPIQVQTRDLESVKPRLHDTTCCQTGCQTSLTTS